jgi:hypothetical protein
VKTQLIEEKILANSMSHKGFLSRIYIKKSSDLLNKPVNLLGEEQGGEKRETFPVS